jgi:hypothetical protein
VLQHIEQPGLRPVQVIDHQHHRLPPGELLEEHPHRPRNVLRHGRVAVEPGEREQPCHHVRGIGTVAERRGERRLGSVGRLIAGQAGGAEHSLAQRPVGGALAVRQAAPHQHRRISDRRDELFGQPALPHAGGAEDGDEQAGAFAPHPPKRVIEQPQLQVATDK